LDVTLRSFFAIAAAAVVAPIIADLFSRILLPVVVVEIFLGIILGPNLLGWVQRDAVVDTFRDFGLAFLFFLAGWEIDFFRIRGRPVRLGILGWLLSLALALAMSTVLWATGLILTVPFVAVAISTTAIGTLLPIIADTGDLHTPFGALLLAAGAAGEFGPIVLIALLLNREVNRFSEAMLLNGYAAVTVAAIFLATRWHPRRIVNIEARTMHSSGQLSVRLALLTLIVMVALATYLQLDMLLGAFAAGVLAAQAAHATGEVHVLHEKFQGIGFGIFIPVFLISTGVRYDLHALLASMRSLLLLPLFLGLFLVARGTPALVLYRGETLRNRAALGVMTATQLPIVVAVSELGVKSGQMRPETSAALIGAAMLSVLLFPLIGLVLRRGGVGEPIPLAAVPTAAELDGVFIEE
jgi:Kef-type K+ transport system membrane component KefB